MATREAATVGIILFLAIVLKIYLTVKRGFKRIARFGAKSESNE